MIELIHKVTVNELFNAAHSKVQIHQHISKTYKVVFNFKTALKSTRNVIALRFTTILNSRLIFQNFSKLIHQICFEILIYYNLTNKAISISIEFTHLLFVSVLRAHFFQLSSVISFSHLFSLSLTILFIDVTIFFIFTSATFRYSLFISFAFMILFIFAFKKTNFVIFYFHIYFEKEIIKIMFIEVFDY